MLRKSLFGVVAAVSAATFMMPASAADMKLTATAIGRPPIFSNTFVDVGETKGYWKKAGLDVNFRWFQRGTDTAKAVVTGDAQRRLHRDAAGGEPDRLRRQDQSDRRHAEPGLADRLRRPSVKGCKDLKGKTVAADGINNARYLFLQSVVENCGLKLTDLKLINLANAPLVKAGIAGQVHNGVWHIDELAQVEHVTKKNWTQITFPPSIKAGLHYAVLVASDKAIKDNREGVIRFLVGWIETQKFMGSKDAGRRRKSSPRSRPKPARRTSRWPRPPSSRIKSIDYWVDNDGLGEKQLMAQVNDLVNVGIMKAANKPSYDKIVDTSLYAEAMKRVKAMK